LSQARIELGAEIAFSQWREFFDSRVFSQAATEFEKIRSASAEPGARRLASQVEAEHRKMLSSLVASWKKACEGNNRTRMETLRYDAVNVAAGLESVGGVLREMDECTPLPCLSGDPVLAMRRLRTRVDPQIDPSLWRYLSQTLVDISIDEDGAVTVKNISNTDGRLADHLKTALERWRFSPAVIDNQQRCVDTQLPASLILP
jgi:hypothetical protein